MFKSLLLLLSSALLLASCDVGSQEKRWYSAKQVRHGEAVFAQHCAACHGGGAQGLVKDWQTPLPSGTYPPPPLDGSAHAWHHDLPLLVEIVQQGGALFDGRMPAFGQALSEQEQLAAIAWFQSLWSDETYAIWRGGKPVVLQDVAQGEQP